MTQEEITIKVLEDNLASIMLKKIALQKEEDSIRVLLEINRSKLLSKPLNATRIIDCDFSIRALNCLRDNNITTLQQLESLSKNDIASWYRCGSTTVNEISDMMNKHGLSLQKSVVKSSNQIMYVKEVVKISKAITVFSNELIDHRFKSDSDMEAFILVIFEKLNKVLKSVDIIAAIKYIENCNEISWGSNLWDKWNFRICRDWLKPMVLNGKLVNTSKDGIAYYALPSYIDNGKLKQEYSIEVDLSNEIWDNTPRVSPQPKLLVALDDDLFIETNEITTIPGDDKICYSTYELKMYTYYRDIIDNNGWYPITIKKHKNGDCDYRARVLSIFNKAKRALRNRDLATMHILIERKRGVNLKLNKNKEHILMRMNAALSKLIISQSIHKVLYGRSGREVLYCLPDFFDVEESKFIEQYKPLDISFVADNYHQNWNCTHV